MTQVPDSSYNEPTPVQDAAWAAWHTRSMLQLGEREWWLAYAAALRIVRAPDQAEDVAQEALLRAHRARDTFDGRSRPESWLWRIAHNAAISHARTSRRFCSLDDLEPDYEDERAARRQSPEDAAASREELRVVDLCLCAMSEGDRATLIAAELFGASSNELGTLLGVSPNAAKQRLFRARRDLRQRLAVVFPEPR